MRHRLARVLPALILAGIQLFAGAAGAAVHYRGGLGVGFQAPREGDLQDLYGTGPSFHLMAEAEIDRVPMSLAAEVGYARATSGHLQGVFFADRVEGKLRRIPIDLVARFPFTDSVGHPFVGAGFELLCTKESFSYRLDGESMTREPSTRYNPGGLVVLGYERSSSPRLRLEGILSYVPVRRQVSRADSYDPAGAKRIDEGSIGVRIYWRLP